MLRRIACVVLLAFVGASCSRDPEVVKRKYVQSGNRYFEKGKYKEAYIMYRNALKKDSKYSEAYYRVGLTELRLGQTMAALRDLHRAIDTDPNFTNPDARVQAANIVLAGYLTNRERPAALRDEVRSLSDELLKRDPKSLPGLRLRGYLKLVADNDPKAAIEQFRMADRISPSDPDIVLPLVQSLMADGQGAEAEKMGRDLIAKRKDFLPMYDVLYVAYVRSGRINEAEQILKQKADNNPQPGFILQLAQHYYRAGKTGDMQATLKRLISNPKLYPKGRQQVGKFYATIRDYDAAMRQFQEGMKEDPDSKPDYQREIAQLLIVQNKKSEANRLLEEVLNANPKDERARAMRSSLLIETGDPQRVQQAITELQSAVGQDPKNPVLRFNLGRALLAKGQLDQARVQFQEAIKLHKEYLPARLALAQLYMVRREYANAIQAAKEVLDYDPRNLSAKLIRTTGLAAIGNNALARTELAETIRLYPNSVDAALQLAVLDLGEKRYKEAEEEFTQLYRAHPADLRALMGAAETYAVQDQFDKAIQLLQGEIVRNPGRLELRNALGNIAFRGGKYGLAADQYEFIIKARPEAGDVYLRLGQTLAMKGDEKGALRTFEKAQQLRPNDPAAYVQVALLLERTGQRDKARPVYEQILRMKPDHPIALNNLAYLMAESGNTAELDQALALAQQARQKLPDNPDVADTLGWIYIKKNLSDNAVDLLSNLVAKNPGVSIYHYHLAMALYQRGDKQQAKKELRAAMERKPSAEQAAKIKELLSKIG
jgi:tetratricopeptide (TPR) repeat protein